ncbi:hypothetical protein SDC9_160864 [bioreactor metagenome]|uniref:Uncharacterized protein n=1 Tax=bioreactor metagenome TaxID=1076179 RepID=A0A645FMW7_9ZZZZ
MEPNLNGNVFILNDENGIIFYISNSEKFRKEV